MSEVYQSERPMGQVNSQLLERIATVITILSGIGALGWMYVEYQMWRADQCAEPPTTENIEHRLIGSAGPDPTLLGKSAVIVDPPTRVRGHKAVLDVRIAREHLSGDRSIWVCVRPSSTGMFWLQNSALDLPQNRVVVQLGEEGSGKHLEPYQIRVASFPKGVIGNTSSLTCREARALGMQTLAWATVDRVD